MISIVIQSDHDVTVTRSPGILSRLLLGRRESTRSAWNAGLHGWIYLDDNREVEADVDEAIERAITKRALWDRFEKLVRR